MMSNENETDNTKSENAPDIMTRDDFKEFGEGIAEGIDLLIGSQPGKFSYVLCIHNEELGEMGIILNVSPEQGFDMVRSVNAQMAHELNKTKAEQDKSIILSH